MLANTNAPKRGAGGDLVGGTTSLTAPAASDNGNSVIGQGCPEYRRARDLSILGALIHKWQPTPRELGIIVGSWSKVDDLDGQLFLLLIERTAPSRECADPLWFRALTSEESVANIVAERCRGFMPPELIDDAAAAFAAVVFGRLRVKAVRHAA